MKYFIIFFIISLFGYLGFRYKKGFIIRRRFIFELIGYIEFYDSNISVFKKDLYEINNNYIIMQNNKNANIYNILIKNDNIYDYNYEILEKLFSKDLFYSIIKNYFKQIGSGEYYDEKNKNLEIKKMLSSQLIKYDEEIKLKGDLGLKILLAVGAVLAIILW